MTIANTDYDNNYSNSFTFKNTFSAPAQYPDPALNAAAWIKIEDYATQIRILSLQARCDDSVSVDQLQNAFEITANIQEQLRIIMQQKTGFSFSTAEESTFSFRDMDSRSQIKKRKKKDQARHCHNCKTCETPEWRRGPDGPRTLCNACGLKWAKKRRTEEKKSNREFDGESEHTMPQNHSVHLPTIPSICKSDI